MTDLINISGVTYYKLNSTYQGDTTKNCGLIGSEIDKNFYNLRGHDIYAVTFSNNKLILKRVNGSEIHVDMGQTPEITEDNLTFRYDKSSGDLSVEYPNGDIATITGFTNNALTEIYTDRTLNGNGTMNNPLRVSNIEETGSYSPANKYFELESGEEIPSVEQVYGNRIVTKEIVNNFGELYSKNGLDIISGYLYTNQSDWRVPSKDDWDLLLDSLEDEHTEEDYYPHSSTTTGFLGEDAAQPLKSDFLWAFNDNPIEEDGTCGFEVIGFDIVPVGHDMDNNKVSEDFNSATTFWTTTTVENGNYVKGFYYDTNKVMQDILNNGFCSIRLVKDFDGSNYRGDESIFGQSYPTILIPETNQIWTSINVYATKKQLLELSKGVNFIDVNTNGANFDNVRTVLCINEWNGSEWIKKELKEGDSIVIYKKDIDDEVTRYYRRWIVKDNDLYSFEDYIERKILEIEEELSEIISVVENRLDTVINNG